MKLYLLPIVLLISVFASAQKKSNGYISLQGGAAFKEQTKGIAHLSVGVSNNSAFGLGLGVGYINFEKPYIPFTADISFFGKPGKISPVVLGSAGYGIHNYSKYGNVTRGGFTGSIKVGIALPTGGASKFFLTGGYSIYSFTGKRDIGMNGDGFRADGNIKMLTVTGGFKF
jgi:hypothetical protein